MGKDSLKIDWATYKAANYACMNWHYSKAMPSGKLVKVGAWENGVFIGVVMFGRGANKSLGRPYGLKQNEVCELVRVALTVHKNPVSRILSLAIKFLRRYNPKLRLVVSYADTTAGHHGGIYQACNWLYVGKTSGGNFYKIKGKLTHPRTLGCKGVVQNIHGARRLDPNASTVFVPGKHKYILPLDTDMLQSVRHSTQPYPKRVK